MKKRTQLKLRKLIERIMREEDEPELRFSGVKSRVPVKNHKYDTGDDIVLVTRGIEYVFRDPASYRKAWDMIKQSDMVNRVLVYDNALSYIVIGDGKSLGKVF